MTKRRCGLMLFDEDKSHQGEQIQGSASCTSHFDSWFLLQHLKMTLMMKTCFFSLAILFLWRMQAGAEACTCVNIPPQQVFCRADMLFRAFVTGKQIVKGPFGNRIVKYDVEVTKVYKGPANLFDAVYTASNGGECGASLEAGGQQYVLTGRMEDDGTVHVSMCDFHVLWYDLTDAQRRDLIRCSQSSCVC